MAIGAMTRTAADSGASSPGPVFFDRISFAGDGAYPTGGTTGFETAYRALTKSSRNIVAVIPADCGGYVACFLPSTGALKVYYANNDGGADGPLIEVPNAADLSGVTFNLIVVSA